MSSQEEEPSPPHVSEPEQAKRKKKQRACDYCRRKKIRCDGAEMPDHRCSRCITQGIVCTYEPINTRPPSKSYVHILENRLQNMEKLFAHLHPNVEIPRDFDGTLDSTHWRVAPSPTQASTMPTAPSPRSSVSVAGVSPPPVDPPSPVDEDELDPSEDEREAKVNIIENLRRITISAHPGTMRYHGKSSNLMFLQTVMKQKYPTRSKSAEPAVTGIEFVEASIADFPFLKAASRERDNQPPYSNFPPPDLMEKLTDGFFENLNIYLPLLHKPTFQNGIRDGLHLRDHAFGTVVLLVCANGALWTDDSRLNTDDGTTPGWSWFIQVDTVRWSLLSRPKLEDLQACALIACYLGSSNKPQGSWNVMGLGLRLAQDVGAHRKKTYGATPSVEDELLRRAVWVLVTMDRTTSFGLGRPCGLHDEDFDLDPLTEVDDEYWLNPDPDLAFKQPEGKPSKVTFANCFVRLQKILAYASRTIYSINKSKQLLGHVGPEWERQIVAELDSALNKWIDTVPEHLKWDPNREDDVFMNQSCALYANYYLLQICIHRPFIQPSKANRLPFPSLTICTNAARSATHVMETQFQKNKKAIVLNRLALFTSGLVLLFNLWGGKRSGLSNETTMADVQKCMQMLLGLEPHSFSARRLLDVLNGLISRGDFLPPGQSHPTASGRSNLANIIGEAIAQDAARTGSFSIMRSDLPAEEPAEDPRKNGLSPYYYVDQPTAAPSPATSSSRSSRSSDTYEAANGNFPMDMSFELPLHTEDLGRVPFHHGFSSPFPSGPAQEQLHFPPQLQQQQTYYPDPHRNEDVSSLTIPLPQSGNVNGNGFGSSTFNMTVADYSQLLAAMSTSGPSSSDVNGQQQMHPQAMEQAMVAPGSSADADVSMMFEDNMVEMWSSAPTSLEWADWGAYLTSVTGMEMPFNTPPQGV